MKVDKFILATFLILFFSCTGKESNGISELENEINKLESLEDKKQYLEKILEDDQKVRGIEGQELMLKYGKDSKEHMDYIKAQWKQDEINLRKIETYLGKYDYPKKDEMGKDVATAPWIVIHHQTDTEIRNRNFETLYKAYLSGDIDDTAMSFYLGRTYEFTFNERFRMKSPFKSEDEINQLIEKLNLEEKKANVLNSIERSEMQLSLKANAIPINNLSNLDNDIYGVISSYDVIMIGEMHGTNEPSEFAYGLCKLIAQNEERVILGMEISPSQMDGFSDAMSIEQLKKLAFFNGENSSGMNGEAWLNLLDRSNQNNRIITKFFDYQRVAPRDSSMYNAICEIRKTYPNTKIVTLSGNLHNWLKPFRGNKMLGSYLMNDTINFDRNKIMSIMHFYNEGTMLNNTGNGLELRTIEGKDNIFNNTISSDKFFCKRINKERDYYTHFFYTNKVSHSKVIETN